MPVMRRTRIKICGVTTPQTAIAAAEAGADAVGLVFVEASPRCLTLDAAKDIVRELPAFVTPVALFVDIPVDDMRRTVEALHIRVIQLHGREGPAVVESLQPHRVIKSLGFTLDEAHAQLPHWRKTSANLAAILWDTPPANQRLHTSLTGGSGRPFDWHALADFQRDGGMDGLPPLVLAGGLTPQNVMDAIGMLQPWAVDVSSGVESTPGHKDPAMIHDFCQAVIAADHHYSMA